MLTSSRSQPSTVTVPERLVSCSLTFELAGKLLEKRRCAEASKSGNAKKPTAARPGNNIRMRGLKTPFSLRNNNCIAENLQLGELPKQIHLFVQRGIEHLTGKLVVGVFFKN